MLRRNFLQTTLGLGSAAALGCLGWPSAAGASAAGSGADLQWRSRTLTGMGTVLTLRAGHAEAARAERALDAAVVTLRRVEAQMSLFNPDSAISRLNRDQVLISPDPDLVRIFQRAQSVSARSQGAFDVTVQPLWSLFEAARRRGSLPSPAAVAQARAAVGWQKLDISTHEIRLRQPGMAVTLNGIAQGFAADLVRTGLQQHGIVHALINTGEWTALGRPQLKRRWTLGIADPRHEQALIARLAMDGRSIASSADNQTTFSQDRRNHHIFDPHTGYSPPELASVTVAARDCALADALTKVMFVAGYRGALQLARQWQVDVLVVDKKGNWEATQGLQLQAT